MKVKKEKIFLQLHQVSLIKGLGLKYGFGCDLMETCTSWDTDPFYKSHDEYRYIEFKMLFEIVFEILFEILSNIHSDILSSLISSHSHLYSL